MKLRAPFDSSAPHHTPSKCIPSTMVNRSIHGIDGSYLNAGKNGDIDTHNTMTYDLSSCGSASQISSGHYPCETLEPQLLFLSDQSMACKESYACFQNNYCGTAEAGSAFYDSPQPTFALPLSEAAQEHDLGLRCNTTCPLISPTFGPGENESATDKPYARLIYEALMQAPGHRLMLRELYEWFIRNTTKPQESGSNGWQNSIRHNLSMNQAFENDKSEQQGRGQSKKANSVWFLTPSAITNGVQSTTRYRKQGPSKRYSRSHTPTSPRQKSGARGGRATKRVAMSRQHGHDTQNDCGGSLFELDSLQYFSEADTRPADYEIATALRPDTPGGYSNMVYGPSEHNPVPGLQSPIKDCIDSTDQPGLTDLYSQTSYDDLTLLERDPASLMRMFE